MKRTKTKEPQNQIQFDTYREKGPVRLGPWTSHIWRSDPRHLGFLLARYKFCAKMLAGKSEVLEIGCGDAFGTQLVLQTVESIHGIDMEPLVVEDIPARLNREDMKTCGFSAWDITERPLPRKFDAAYALDVIEHVPPESENRFMANICGSLRSHGACIIGTPNAEVRTYASPASAAGHVNLKSAETLREILLRYFYHAFIFSMNDEVVHTGFYPLAHYLLGVGVEQKE